MTLYDDIYEIAADNYGLITTAEIKELGGENKDALRLMDDGRLTKIGRGVYRIKHYIPTKYDSYAECVALVGADAYLYGESVIAMHELAPTNPYRMFVATSKRVRKELPESIIVVQRDDEGDITAYEGIPSQKIFAAILSCKKTIMRDRLIAAAKRARELGFIRAQEEIDLLEELGDDE